jgi:CYTH domain-containing protein
MVWRITFFVVWEMKMQVNKMKYARIERERRFLLWELPDGLEERPYTHVTDHYLPDTRLRLRRMTDEMDNIVALKLTQKFGETAVPTQHTTITNIYLNEAEYQTLAQLGGDLLTKRRYRYSSGNQTFSVDVFEGQLSGLILAEIEAQTDEQLQTVSLPAWAVAEVTNDNFFTGGNLVTVTLAQLQAELAKHG